MSIESIIENIRRKRQYRLDADEEQEEVPKKKTRGNTRLPYGLCKSEGIGTEGLTPKEAWEAYFKKTGVSPDKAYEDHFGKEKKEKKKVDPFETITKDNVEAAFEEERRLIKEIVDAYDYDAFRLASKGMLKKLGIGAEEEKKIVGKLRRLADLQYKRGKFNGWNAEKEEYYTGDELKSDSIDGCTSIAHIRHYMDDKYGVEVDSAFGEKVGGLNRAKEYMNGAEYVLSEFPELRGTLKKIDAEESDYGTGGSYYFAVDAFTPNRIGFIGMNPEITDDQIKVASEKKKIHKNSSRGSLMAHECAHALEHWLTKQMGLTEEGVKNAMLHHAVAKNIVEKAITDMGIYASDARFKLRESISKYASTNYAETMAEAFGDCYANGDNANELSKRIVKITTDMANEVRNKKH